MSISTHSPLRRGLTLVELLIVIAIMATLTALLVPHVRTVNKDRSIREAARIVGAAFAEASNRGIVDGTAGVLVRRNANFVDPNTGVQYGSNSIFQMRKVPPYSGALLNEQGTIIYEVDPMTMMLTGRVYCQIPMPADINAITEGDVLFFPASGSKNYRVESFVPDSSDPTLYNIFIETTNTPYPIPANGAISSYRVERKPQIIDSSEVVLPDGYLVDLRFSGPQDSGDMDGNANTHTLFSQAGDTDDIIVYFDRTGGISDFWFNGGIVRFGLTSYFFVHEYGVTDDTGTATEIANRLLSDPSSLWVVVDKTSGSTSVSNHVPSDSGTVISRILNGQQFSRNRSMAAQ